MLAFHKQSLRAVFVAIFCLGLGAYGQSGGASTSVDGTVVDSSGAVVPNATVEIQNVVSGFQRTTITDKLGKFSIANVPFNPYHLTVSASGFTTYAQDIDVRSVVPVSARISMKVAGSSETVTVEASGEDLLENTPSFHTDVDKELFEKLPLESQSSSVSSLVTLASPGIAADSNGLFHGLGDHAENSFSVDGQPITDQQSKVFSNQIPLDSIESMEVIAGAPPAEYGDKTSVVINVTTRSGQGMSTPHGEVTTSYGSFGTSNLGFNLGYGGKNWGNFVSLSGLNTSRFLDPPEFTAVHDKGNEENGFDRLDFQLSGADSIHINLGYTRSWFQTPNSFDSQNATGWASTNGLDPNGNLVGPADQRSQIKTFNIAPSWTHLVSSHAVFTFGGFVRRDQYQLLSQRKPVRRLCSRPAIADRGPEPDAHQRRSALGHFLCQRHAQPEGGRHLRTDFPHGERQTWGSSILDSSLRSPIRAAIPVWMPAPILLNLRCTDVAPYDLTRGGTLFPFNGHTDVKELALYIQDEITKGNWNFNLGLRGDFYNGLTTHREAEPRVGIAYNIKSSNTVLRISYARTLETPFNENLVLSSIGCANAVLNPLLGCSAPVSNPLSPGWRNEFHAGIQQAFGKYVVFSGEYIWKYTHNAYDFSVLGSTPITFPIEWDHSKIPGYAGRVSVPNLHGVSALMVFSGVAARFFTPQIGGAGAVPGSVGAFRIDHDEKFNMTAHLQYQPWKKGPWFGFNWRYDSGLVAGAAPCYGIGSSNDCPDSFDANGNPITINGQPAIDLSGLTADQQFQAGLFCGSVRATPTMALPSPCLASQFGSSLVKVPAPGTQNDDHNPARIAPRNLFDLAVGDDNLLHGDRYKWSLQLTAVNLTNKYALYNFLSTFSGTHYVTPRALTAQLGFHF